MTHGQVPHPVGMWTLSMITSPPLKVYCVEMRMLLRVSETCPVVSTRMIAFPFSIEIRSLDSCRVTQRVRIGGSD